MERVDQIIVCNLAAGTDGKDWLFASGGADELGTLWFSWFEDQPFAVFADANGAASG